MNFNTGDFYKEEFDAEQFLNENFLAKIEIKDLSSLDFNKIQDNLMNFQENLTKLKQRFAEELETCVLVNEINAETRENEQIQALHEYEEIESLALELEYALTRSEDSALHLENSLKFLETEKSRDILTKELLSQFLALNKEDSDEFADFCFEKQALSLHILHKVATTLNNSSEYARAIAKVKQKFESFKEKLMAEFKEAFWRYDTKKLRSLTHFLEEYGLLAEMSLFFIETSLQDVKSFKAIADFRDFETNCRLFQGTLEATVRGFSRLFAEKREFFQANAEKSPSGELEIQEVFGERAPEIVNQAFSLTFERFLRKSLEYFLEPSRKSGEIGLYLKYVEFLMLKIREFSAEVLEIRSPIHAQIREVLHSYTNTVAEELRNGYYELELAHFQGKLEENVAKVLLSFKNSENSKKTTHFLGDSKKKPFSFNFNELLFRGESPAKSSKKLSKNERIRRLQLLLDPSLHEIVELCFASLQESARRCLLISPELSKTLNIYGLLQAFLNSFAVGLLEPLINFVEELVPGLNSSKPLDPQFFEVASKLNVYIQRVDLAHQNSTKNASLINESQEFLNKKDALLQKLVILLHKAIQSALASVFIHSNKILSEKQKKKDFLQENRTGSSEACVEFVKYLKKYVQIIKDFAFDRTRNNIFASLGTQIIAILGEHFLHYKVAIGSQCFFADLLEYSRLIEELADENLRKEWEIFQNSAKILAIPAEKVQEFVKEKGIENKEVMMKFLKNR